MKRLFVLLISISMVAYLYAVPSKKYKLVVKTTDSEYSYALYKQPEISFTNTDMVIKMDQEDVRFAKSDIVDFLFDYNQYKITFLDWDGDTLQSSMVMYGEYPSYNGATPERESDNRHTYTFSDWSPELDTVTEDVTYIAQYQEIIRYEVAFYNWDGTLLQSNWYVYGEYPSYTGETPIRKADAQYTYTFVGWSPEPNLVAGDQYYYAQYDATLNQYEINFYDWDGTLLQSSMANYGEWPAYYNSDPWREADAQYTYTFSGWSPELSMVTGHLSYYAQYEATLNQYEINFYNWDGTLLQSNMVNCGEWPMYYNSDPWRESDAQYTYTFTGWSPELSMVTGHQSYYAQYESTLNQYEINFYDWDGTLLQSSMMNYGEWPTYYNSEPLREDDAHTYTFVGWGDVSQVTGHASYYAQYEATLKQYEINFYDWNGTLLQSSMVNYGEWPTYYNSEPTLEADAQYTYNFSGWSPELRVVTGNQAYTAQYDSTLNQYEINFYNWDGTLLQSEWLNYGEWPNYYNSEPTREADAQYTYTFTGWWSPELSMVTGTANYYAQYDATLNQYEINFYDWDGTLLQSEWLNYGEWPNYYNSEPTREADAQYTYTFTGWWSPELSVVTGTANYYAQYDATLNQYEINFYDWDGTLLQSSMVNYGEMPEYHGVTPTKPEDEHYIYTFSGWEPEITIVVAYAEYTAQYDATDKVTTAIQNTQSDEVKTYKILRNNKIFIIRGDKVYSILGHVIED